MKQTLESEVFLLKVFYFLNIIGLRVKKAGCKIKCFFSVVMAELCKSKPVLSSLPVMN